MAASAPTAAPHARLEKPPAYRWWILVANMLAYGQFFLTVQVVNAFSSTVQAEWHLAAADLALLTTVTLAGYALASGIGGKLEKRFGARRTVVGGIAANVVLGLLFPTAGSAYAGMIVLRFLQGVAGGCIASSVVSSTVLWFPVRQRGLAQGLLMGVLGFGFALASLCAPLLLDAGMTWQFAAAVLVVAPGAAIAAVYAVSVRDLGAVYPEPIPLPTCCRSMGAPPQLARAGRRWPARAKPVRATLAPARPALAPPRSPPTRRRCRRTPVRGRSPAREPWRRRGIACGSGPPSLSDS